MENNNKHDIVEVIQNYYASTFKNNFDFLNICDKEDVKILTSFFFNAVFDKNSNNVSKQYLHEFKKFDSILEEILESSLIKITKYDLEKKMDLFFSNLIFSVIDKSEFVRPEFVLSRDLLTTSVNKSFFKKVLYKTVLNLIYAMLQDLTFYKKSLNTNIFYSSYKDIRKNLDRYHDVFLNFYNGLINKYDPSGDYIFPIYSTANNNIHYSKVVTKDQPLEGGNGEVKKVKEQLNNLFENNIKHVYDKEELKQLEALLENNKINTLIARKELKLAPGFNNLIKNVLNENNTDEEKKKYFDEIFDLNPNEDMTKEELYKIYKEEPNKEGFLNYVVDKTMYQTMPLKTENNSNELKIVALVDNIFDKILKEDYNHNSLNLQDDDMKFILMLETLNSIKTTSSGNQSNITVNLYKDVDKTKINKDEIDFN